MTCPRCSVLDIQVEALRSHLRATLGFLVDAESDAHRARALADTACALLGAGYVAPCRAVDPSERETLHELPDDGDEPTRGDVLEFKSLPPGAPL